MTLFKLNCEREEITTIVSFRGETETLLDEHDTEEQYNNQEDLVMRCLKDFFRDDSA